MGAGPSVKLTADADSIMEPGTQVVMSEPLELDFDALFDECLEQNRYPVGPMKEYVLKECAVEDHGKDDFTVKVVLDGKKLDGYGYGRGDGIDRIDFWSRVQGDRAKRTITNSVIVAPPGCWMDEADSVKAGGGSFMGFNKDPLTVEYYITKEDGSKLEGAAAEPVCASVLGPAVVALSKTKVKAKADQPSIKTAGLTSVLSESLEGHTTFDAFWDRLLQVMKKPPQVTPEVIEVSDSEFHIVMTDPTNDQKVVTKVRHCKDSGELECVSSNDGGILSKTVTIIHKDPFLVEYWGEDREGARQSGRGTARTLQVYLDMVLAPPESGWFSSFF